MFPLLGIAMAGAGIASAGLQIAGAMQSSAGAQLAAEGAQEQAEAQLRAERVRKKQMLIDFRRARRDAIRQGIVARSQALTAATAQGVTLDDSSAVTGASGVTTQTGRTILAQQQNKKLGNKLFAANFDYYKAGEKVAAGQGQIAAGQGISSLGSALGSSIGPLSKLGTLAFGGGV